MEYINKNTALYLVSQIKNCTKEKLFLAVYILDCTHYMSTGITWTNIKYQGGGFKKAFEAISVYFEKEYEDSIYVLRGLTSYNEGYFSKHALNIMNRVVIFLEVFTFITGEEIENIEEEFKDMREVFGSQK